MKNKNELSYQRFKNQLVILAFSNLKQLMMLEPIHTGIGQDRGIKSIRIWFAM